MFVSYAPGYFVDIGDAHVFPMRKFPLVYERLVGERILTPEEVVAPAPAREEDILLAHTRDYWTRLAAGRLTPREIRRLGLPWSEALVTRARLATQGTLNAARHALAEGVAGNLAGGTHHAFPDHGEGFCVLNDIAVAVRVLQRDGDVGRVALIDCDVHQGNANAVIFAGESDVFTFSMHGKNNYPLRKPPGSLDVELPDGMTDEPYLDLLREYVPRVLKTFRPDLVFYLAGVDPYVHDRFGRLALSLEGLLRRDEFVLRACRRAGVPVAVTLSGGYARDRDDTVAAHCNTYRAAREVFG